MWEILRLLLSSVSLVPSTLTIVRGVFWQELLCLSSPKCRISALWRPATSSEAQPGPFQWPLPCCCQTAALTGNETSQSKCICARECTLQIMQKINLGPSNLGNVIFFTRLSSMPETTVFANGLKHDQFKPFFFYKIWWTWSIIYNNELAKNGSIRKWFFPSLGIAVMIGKMSGRGRVNINRTFLWFKMIANST